MVVLYFNVGLFIIHYLDFFLFQCATRVDFNQVIYRRELLCLHC